MDPQFNLIDEPWIPVLDATGQRKEVGLRQALADAHTFVEIIGDSPPVTASLYRLLLAVLHRVFGPPDSDAWVRLWQARRWDAAALDDYWERWRDRFWLFHSQRPFMQAADARVRPKGVSNIIHHLSSGNNALLFDHSRDDLVSTPAVSPSLAACHLVTAQVFGLAGLSGLPEKFTAGACVGRAIFLVQGDTLFETLARNLLPYPAEAPIESGPYDAPAWEMDDPFQPDRTVPLGYLDYLTWCNRRILLIPEDGAQGPEVRLVTIGPGLRFETSALDPMKHYRRDPKRGPVALRFTEERALWRDSAVLLQTADDAASVPPAALRWVAQLERKRRIPHGGRYRLLALGLANNDQAAKIDFYRAERMPVPVEYLRDKDHVDDLRTAMQMAEDAGKQLWGAVSSLAQLLLSPDADQKDGRQPDKRDADRLMTSWGAERLYWAQLELSFRSLLESLPHNRETALTMWRAALQQAAWSAFDSVDQGTGQLARSWKAIVQARSQLAAGLAKVLPKEQTPAQR